MNVNLNRSSCHIPPILNQNWIKEEPAKEAILAMGMGICQITCTGGGQKLRFYCQRH